MPSTTPPPVGIRLASFPADHNIVSTLFRAYSLTLPNGMDAANFATELSSLPGKYAAEDGGAVFLAYTTIFPSTAGTATSLPPQQESKKEEEGAQEQVLGIVAIRVFSAPTSCELKRLYLTPEGRGRGIGRALLEAAVKYAKERGHEEMLLDTLKTMTVARALYEKIGFMRCDGYYEGCDDEVVVCYRLKL